MEAFARVAVAAGYSFSAWLLAAMMVYAATSTLPPGPLAHTLRCGALLTAFVPVFAMYFRRPLPLPPLMTAAVGLSLIAALDLALIAPHFPRRYDLFLSVWDWQVPALLVGGSIYLTGRRAQASLKQTLTTPS